MLSYRSAASSALHGVEQLRNRKELIGLLELNTIWPFPYDLVREKCANARRIIVVEMNMGQVLRSVKLSVDNPERVVLANRIDGVFISDGYNKYVLLLFQGKGV